MLGALRRIRLAHVFSSDLGIRSSLPFVGPLRELGWEITFLTPAGPDVERARDHGYRWLPITFKRRMDLVGDLIASVDLARTLARERFDIVHTHNVKVGLVGRVLSGLLRAPVVLHTLHGLAWSLETPEPAKTAHAMLERIASLGADLTLSQSQEDRDACVAMSVMPSDRIRVIGNGIDLSRFHPDRVGPGARERTRRQLGIADDEILVVFCGRVVREKGVEEVFRAATELRGARIKIAVVGRSDEERADAPSPASFAEGRAAGVLMLGERADIPELYAAADVAALASWREGMPRALMEGAAMGKALLATDVRGCREVVRHEVTGLLTRPRDPTSLAAGVRRLAQDPMLRERMGAAARRDALERFDLDACVRRVVSAYEDVLLRKACYDARSHREVPLG